MKSVAGGALLAGPVSAVAPALALADDGGDPSAGLYPVKRNPKYTLDRDITDEKWSTSYNNFYEFGTDKSIARAAQKLPIRPWTVEIGGMVDKPMTLDIDDLLKKMPLEERLYRHRCVETWAMAVPWSGFPLKALVEMAQPDFRRQIRQDDDLQDAFRSRLCSVASAHCNIPGPISRA